MYWAIGVIGIATVLTLYYQYRYQTYIISLVFLWAMIGVLAAHDIALQQMTVIGYMVVVILSMGYTYIRK